MLGSSIVRVRTCTRRLLALLASTFALSTPLSAQTIVFDPSNYSQTLLTAARVLQQINNQLRSLENEALLLIHSSRNLTRLPTSVAGELKTQLDDIHRLMSQANGLAFEVERSSRDFERLYPRAYDATVSSDRMVMDAQARWSNSHEALKHSLLIQSRLAQAIGSDGHTLQGLMAASSGAVGALQAQQAGNELAALGVKQSLQLQTLLATQGRADTTRAAEQQVSAEAARERFTRFIGKGRAYSGR